MICQNCKDIYTPKYPIIKESYHYNYKCEKCGSDLLLNEYTWYGTKNMDVYKFMQIPGHIVVVFIIAPIIFIIDYPFLLKMMIMIPSYFMIYSIIGFTLNKIWKDKKSAKD